MAVKRKQIVRTPEKHAHSHGTWKPAVTKSVILVCKSCKIRYIKTRKDQMTCVKCMLAPLPTAVFRLHKD